MASPIAHGESDELSARFNRDVKLTVARASLDTLPREVIVTHVVCHLTPTDVASLAKTCGRLFRALRHERLYRLWPLYNRKYLSDAHFRDEVQRFIPVHRLVLEAVDDTLADAPDEARTIDDLSPFVGVHTADLRCAIVRGDVSPLSGVHTLLASTPLPPSSSPLRVRVLEASNIEGDLSMYAECLSVDVRGISDVSAFVRARSVVLRVCNNLRDVSALAHAERVWLVNCPQVSLSSISALRGIVSVTLWNAPFTAVPREFSRLYKLDLSKAQQLRDVTHARAIHTLTLRDCSALLDVAPLAHVHTLDLSDFLGEEGAVRDVSSLGGVHTLLLKKNVGAECCALKGVDRLGKHHKLSLAHVNGVRGFSHLGSVHTLDLAHTGLASVEGLGSVHTLNLLGCDALSDVSSLDGVHNLTLAHCGQLDDVSALRHVHTLCLNFCTVGKGFELLGGVHTLALKNAVFPSDLSPLASVYRLDLSATDVTNVSPLSGVHLLTLAECFILEDVSSLGAVYDLDLSLSSVCDVSSLGTVRYLRLSQTHVSDVSALGRVHYLDLSYCNGVVDVSVLGHVDALDLRGCQRLEDVSALGGVCTLDIRECPLVRDKTALGGVKKLFTD